MQMPNPKPGLTHTPPKTPTQSESCVQIFRQARPPLSMQISSGPLHPKPGHWHRCGPQPSTVQYCRQTPPPPQSGSPVQVLPTQ